MVFGVGLMFLPRREEVGTWSTSVVHHIVQHKHFILGWIVGCAQRITSAHCDVVHCVACVCVGLVDDYDLTKSEYDYLSGGVRPPRQNDIYVCL